MSELEREVLDRVRRNQYGGSDPLDVADALEALGSAPRPALPEEAQLEQFLRRLRTNNIQLEVASSRSETVKRIGRFIYNEHNTHRAVAGNDRRLAALPWRDGGVLVRFGAATPDDPVSISYARLGIAETGSLVLYSNRDNPAANTWLPRDHIVVLDAGDLVGHLEDAWAAIRSEREFDRMPRGITMVSGPSSTGDIVGHLVQGAHGPQRLHLIFQGVVADELLENTGHPVTERPGV